MPFSYKPYEESDAVRAARANLEANQNYKESDNVSLARNILAQHEQNKVQDWTGGQYGQSLQQALDRINNREKFTYDLNGDALFQQYKDRYMTQGRMAMMDTLGQTSALTGGYGNSYAATAGNQAYQAYLTQLMDVAPQLYQMAYQRYQDEGNDLKDRLNIYQNLYNTDYGEWRDRMGDWQAEANRLTDRYYNEARKRRCSIGDLQLAIDFSLLELKTDFSGSVWPVLRSADSISEASNIVCRIFENPQFKNYGDRYKAAKDLRDKYAADMDRDDNPETTEPEQPKYDDEGLPIPQTWPPRTVDNHCTGWPEVWLLQGLLKCRGKSVLVDGIWGTVLTDKIKAFQREHGLDPDGAVGPMSWHELGLRADLFKK